MWWNGFLIVIISFIIVCDTNDTGPDAEAVALSPNTLTATNQFSCEVCYREFRREQNLQLHMRGHNLHVFDTNASWFLSDLQESLLDHDGHNWVQGKRKPSFW